MYGSSVAAVVACLAWSSGPDVSVAVFGDNQTDEFLNSLPGVTATVVTDAQLSTPGFLDSFDAFYYTRDGASFGVSLSPAAAANVQAFVDGNVVLFNADAADPLGSDPDIDQMTANAVEFATSTGHGYIGEFNGAAAALTANSDGLEPLGLVSGTAGPLGLGGGGSDGPMDLTPAGVGHPVVEGVIFPIDPFDVEFGSAYTGLDPEVVITEWTTTGLPAIVSLSVVTDSDGDGIPDDEDACPNSDLAPTIVIDLCDTGVENQLFEDGCTMADLIADCDATASNHGGFVSCVAHLAIVWKRAGIITGAEFGSIVSCTAQSVAAFRGGGSVDFPTPSGSNVGGPPQNH